MRGVRAPSTTRRSGCRSIRTTLEVTAGQVTLAFWDPEGDGVEFSPNVGGIALRVPDVAAARAELEAKGVGFAGTDDSGVCRMAFCKDPDGNDVILHRRYKPYE